MNSGSTAHKAVTALLERTRAGHGGALVVRAEPGLGTSTLLARAADSFRDGLVLRARGVAAETGIPYSGLHALLRPVADRPRSAALSAALELGAAPPGGSGPVLAGFLALLHRLASAGRPVLVCVDDAHRLDAASREALGFAARRLGQPLPVAVLAGLPRDGGAEPRFAGLPVVTLRPLDGPAAAALLDRLLPPGTDPAVREALLHAGEGNPGLLTEFVHHLTPRQLAGTEPLPDPLPVGEARDRAAAARLAQLPRSTRALLLLAAAATELAGTAQLDVLAGAAAAAGLDPAALDPAETAGAVRREGDTLRFVHPLLRRAAYWQQPPDGRRTAHRLLARALSGRGHRLLRLRHLAAACPGPDPSLGDVLADEAARRHPGTRDGHAELADALLRAAGLADDDRTRVVRLTAAAEHTWCSGRPQRARVLLDRARELPAPDTERGRTELLRGTLELSTGIVTDAREVLMEAAAMLQEHAPDLAAQALLGAAEASWAAGDPRGYRGAIEDLASRAERIPPVGQDLPTAYAAGMATVLRGRLDQAAAPLRRAIGLAVHERSPRMLMLASGAALVLGDVTAAREIGTRAAAAARTRGPAVLVPRALEHLAYSELRTGNHTRARAHALAGLALAERTGQRNCASHLHAVLAMAAAIEGDEDGCVRHARRADAAAGPHGLGVAATLAQWSLARCDLGLGRAGAAAARLGPLVSSAPAPGQGHFALRMLAIPCFVEASVLAGDPDQARPALVDFAWWTGVTADPRAPAQLLRCRALLAEPDASADLFAAALAEHTRVEGDYERGRTLLLHGMALRRRRRPGEARSVLREALLAFERSRATAWAERTRAELRPAGEAAAPAVPDALAVLTPQQLRIARCVAEGATNREVAARLSVSPRTIDHHLRNVFTTLGIRSRVELTRFLASAGEG
ncbi:helix-turn-helix transcriptional regulator [Streptomyces sodiiphilus]|uniref:Helix-turn-helix transcriptional regulator n=1 Tax=Streptomyces sodiiphilus TaxID=226217 RepID=A0ABN2PR77_9ACTN